MPRFFSVVLMILAIGYAHAAYAANAASTFSVSVTVVEPGTLTGATSNRPKNNSAGGNSSLKEMNNQSSSGMQDSNAYERFTPTDSASKRGGIFPTEP